MLRIGGHPENLKIRQILIQTMGAGRDFAIVPRIYQGYRIWTAL